VKRAAVAMSLVLAVVLTALFRFDIAYLLLHRTLELSLSISISWGTLLAISMFSSVSAAVVLFFSWFRFAIGFRRSPGPASMPIVTETRDLAKRIEATSSTLFAQDTVQDFFDADIVARHLRNRSSLHALDVPEEFSDFQRMLYRRCCRIIAKLDVQSFKLLFSKTDWVHLKERDVIYKQGDLGDSGLFFIIEGTVDLYSQDRYLYSLEAGSYFGETELFDVESKRKITAKAGTALELIRLKRDDFLQVGNQEPRLLLSFVCTAISRNWILSDFVLREVLGIKLLSDPSWGYFASIGSVFLPIHEDSDGPKSEKFEVNH